MSYLKYGDARAAVASLRWLSKSCPVLIGHISMFFGRCTSLRVIVLKLEIESEVYKKQQIIIPIYLEVQTLKCLFIWLIQMEARHPTAGIGMLCSNRTYRCCSMRLKISETFVFSTDISSATVSRSSCKCVTGFCCRAVFGKTIEFSHCAVATNCQRFRADWPVWTW